MTTTTTSAALAATDTAPAVRLDSLSKSYGDSFAVRDLTLDIASGEFFSLLGPSGCGKTTSLRMIGGFTDPTDGTILLGGEDVTFLPPNKRNVNTVFQSYALFDHLSVADNVAFGLKRAGVGRTEIRERVGTMLERVQLGSLADRKPHTLSGGQRQRVALARALVNRPQVLLLDEPLAALDLKLRRQMQVELKQIQREIGITFVFVTHDQDEALTMSDRVAVMSEGRVEQCGTPEDVYERPAGSFVASFMGTSNLVPGTYRAGEVHVDQGPVLPVGPRAGCQRRQPGQPVHPAGEDLALRPRTRHDPRERRRPGNRLLRADHHLPHRTRPRYHPVRTGAEHRPLPHGRPLERRRKRRDRLEARALPGSRLTAPTV